VNGARTMPTVARCLVLAEPPTVLVCQDDQAAVKEAKQLPDSHVIGGTTGPPKAYSSVLGERSTKIFWIIWPA